MTILIVVHNSDLAGQIATRLCRDGYAARVCKSVASPDFATEFPNASLLITDLTPPVLNLLTIAGRPISAGLPPLLVVASPGHVETFASMLPGPSRCLPLEWTVDGLNRIVQLAESLAIRRTPNADVPAPESSESLPAPPQSRMKRVAADAPHGPRHAPRRRTALRRQVQFVSDIAHDLRTPLTAICEFAHLMSSGFGGHITEQQRRYVGIIERRCDEAARMVDDLLDGAKLQSGHMHPHRQPLDLAEVLADVQESLEPTVQHSGVKLEVDVPRDLPRVFADRDMLARILANLTTNAIKFSPANGTVTIRVERQSVSMMRVSVIDRGSGIAPDDLRRIFQRFEQGSNHTREGVGLGLAIVRELVKLHGGRVTVESTPGQGSRFHFTLPMFLPTALVKKHMADVAARRNAAPAIYAIVCTESNRFDAIHRLFSATVRSHDLVLPADDRRRLLLVTQAKRPIALVNSLKRQIRAYGAAVPQITRLDREDLQRWLKDLPGRSCSDQSGPAQRAG